MASRRRASQITLAAALLLLFSGATGAEDTGSQPDEAAGEGAEDGANGAVDSDSRLSDEAIPLQIEAVPKRPKPLLELGEPFLGTGTLHPGFRLPTGAIWQPSLVVFGTLRAAAQSFEDDAGRVSELATRLDLFANLQLSGTERLVVGFRPFDQDGRFTSLVVDSDLPGLDEDFADELNGTITSVYFEGDFGEIFPNLAPSDFGRTDVGFSVGRQPLIFQEGLLINDTIDGIGLTRNSLHANGASNIRATLFFGWNEVGFDNRRDDSAKLLALLTSTDTRRSTWDVDLAYVQQDLDGDLLSGGISAIQRLGKLNSAFRLLGSSALDQETALATDGWLLLNEISWTPRHGHDLVYVNTFVAADEFSSAARGPDTGGPLGRAGINFAAVGLGRYGAALSAEARDVAGAAFGYQRFFDHTRKQLLLELGSRVGTASTVPDAVAVSLRYQAAVGQRYVVVVDGFAGRRQAIALGDQDEELFGGRFELVIKF